MTKMFKHLKPQIALICGGLAIAGVVHLGNVVYDFVVDELPLLQECETDQECLDLWRSAPTASFQDCDEYFCAEEEPRGLAI